MRNSTTKNVIAILTMLSVVGSLSAVAFSKGNVLTIFSSTENANRGNKPKCAPASLHEFTPDGDFVQEILLPAEASADVDACWVLTGEYTGTMTLATDGNRAIVSCCNLGNFNQSVFAIVDGDGQIVTTKLDPRPGQSVLIAVLDGSDIWFNDGASGVSHTTIGASTTTNILANSATTMFYLHIHQGQLYGSTFLPNDYGIHAIGDGLPKEQATFVGYRASVNISVDGFQIGFKFTYAADFYPKVQISKRNSTNMEVLYASSETLPAGSEITQLVALDDSGNFPVKIIAKISSTTAIYLAEYVDDGTSITYVGVWKNRTADNYWKSPIKTPLPKCADQVQNYAETDVDCGGGLCDKCVAGKKCAENSDCQTDFCDGSVCVQQLAPDVQEPSTIITPSTSNTPNSVTTPSPGSSVSSGSKTICGLIGTFLALFLLYNVI